MTRAETAKIMTLISRFFPRFRSDQPIDETVDAYAEVYKDADYMQVQAALMQFLKEDTKGFPPVPGQLFAIIRRATKPRRLEPDEAWTILYRAIQNSAYDSRKQFDALPEDIKAVICSPDRLKAYALEPMDAIGVIESNFKRSYREHVDRTEQYELLSERARERLPEPEYTPPSNEYVPPAKETGTVMPDWFKAQLDQMLGKPIAGVGE